MSRRGAISVAAGTQQNQDVNQDAWIDIGPGQQAFVKIIGTNTWDAGGDNQIYSRDVFYARLMPPQIAQAEIAHGVAGPVADLSATGDRSTGAAGRERPARIGQL